MSVLLPAGVEIEIALPLARQDQAGAWDRSAWTDGTGNTGAVWAETDTTLGDWLDVTCDALNGFEYNAGTDSTDGIVAHWESATVALRLLGDEYNPFAGPYAGLLGPQTPIRIRWRPAGAPDWLGLFLGYVDDDGFKWTRRRDYHGGVAEVAATDGTRLLNAGELLDEPEGFAGETAGARIARLADKAFWPDALRDIDTGGVPLNPTKSAGNAWSGMLAIADADLGALWIGGDGSLRYVSQARVEIGAVPDWRITCEPPSGDGAPAIPGTVLEGQQPTVRRNIVTIARAKPDGAPTDPVPAVRRDERSQDRFGPHQYSRTDLPHENDAWSSQLAAAVLQVGAWPSGAPKRVEVNSRFGVDAAHMLLSLEPDSTIEVTDTTGRAWLMAPVGWEVAITRQAVSGSVSLADVTGFRGGRWDADHWDKANWSY